MFLPIAMLGFFVKTGHTVRCTMLPVFLPQSSNSYKKKKTGLHCAVKYQPLVTGKNKENFAVRPKANIFQYGA
jgi:hypothetical protein